MAKEMTKVQNVCQNIDRMETQFSQALPPDVTVDRFKRVVLTAIQQNEKLADVKDRKSLYNACTAAAQDGLVPDNREGALVIFGDSVQWMPMVNGLIKRAAKSNITIKADIVYEKDEFEYMSGDQPRLYHKPDPFMEDRGQFRGVYAIATLPNGQKMYQVMGKQDIEKVKQASRGSNSNSSPWKNWYEQMALKSVIRRLFKNLPLDMSSDDARRLSEAVERQDEMYDFDRETGEITEPVSEPPKERPKSLDKVAGKSKGTTVENGETQVSENKAAGSEEPPPPSDDQVPEDADAFDGEL